MGNIVKESFVDEISWFEEERLLFIIERNIYAYTLFNLAEDFIESNKVKQCVNKQLFEARNYGIAIDKIEQIVNIAKEKAETFFKKLGEG